MALDLFRFMSYITQNSYRWSNVFYIIIVSWYHILLIIPNLSDQGAQRLGKRKHEVRSCVYSQGNYKILSQEKLDYSTTVLISGRQRKV